MKASISVLGTCVSENVFYYTGLEGNNPFLVKNRLFQISPISALLGERIDILDGLNITESRKYVVDSFWADVNKNCFEILAAKKTDYIVVDMLFCNNDLLNISCGEKEYYITFNTSILNLAQNKKNFEEHIKKQGASYRRVKAEKFVENGIFEAAIEKYCSELLKIYRPEQIIVIEARSADNLILEDGRLCNFSSKYDESFSKLAFELVLKNIPECNVIRSPKMLLSDGTAFNGVNRTHYTIEFYNYVMECLNLIADHKSPSELQKPNDRYTEIIIQRHNDAEKITLEYDLSLRKNLGYELYAFSKLRSGNYDKKTVWLDRIRDFYHINTPFSPPGNNCTYLNEYIDDILDNEKRYVLFFSACDASSYKWHNFTSRKKLGLKCEIPIVQSSYIAVVDIENQKAREIYEYSNKELRYDCSVFVENTDCITDVFDNNILAYNVSISSKGWEYDARRSSYDNWAKIMINNIDYAINKRGLNIVVFSKSEHCVVDSFVVDTHIDASLRIQRNID